MKRHVAPTVFCALTWLAAGLAQGATMPVNRYYGAGPYVQPPYWMAPDLTKAEAGHPAGASLDLTAKQAMDQPGKAPRTWLTGEVLTRAYAFSRPHSYFDHMGRDLVRAWWHSSEQILKHYSPTITSLQPRYNASQRHWDSRAPNYRPAMERFNQSRSRFQPK